jgi:hypothetical protein
MLLTAEADIEVVKGLRRVPGTVARPGPQIVRPSASPISPEAASRGYVEDRGMAFTTTRGEWDVAPSPTSRIKLRIQAGIVAEGRIRPHPSLRMQSSTNHPR